MKQMKINRKRVHGSMWVPIPTVALLLTLIGIVESVFGGHSFDFLELILSVGTVMLIGAVVWVPSAIVCLIIERVGINERTTKSHLMQMLFLEALIPFVIFNAIMSQGNIVVIISTFFIAMLAQLIRWFFLRHKGRMFENGELAED